MRAKRRFAELVSSSNGRFTVTNHNDAVACQTARQTGPMNPATSAGSAVQAVLAAGQHRPRASACRRSIRRCLTVGSLLIFSLGVTAVYIATVTADFQRHHWAGALDASRDAVPAAVGWAALVIVLFAGGTRAAAQFSAADEHSETERQRQAARARDSVRQAEQRVQALAGRLAALSDTAAEGGQSGQLARQIGDTEARLDQARQWLVGARGALYACQPDVARTASQLSSGPREELGPTGRRVA